MRPRIAKPKLEYSYATPGTFENGMPARSIADICSSVSASWRSPHGLSSGKPSACESRWRTVILGASVVGYLRAAISGTYFSAGSSSASLPSSRSLRIDIAVKLFVIDAMRNTVSASTGACAARSRNPVVPVCASSPLTITTHAAPGACACVAYSRRIRSTSANAAGSLVRSKVCAAGPATASALARATRSVRAMARKYVRVARRSGPFVAHERVAPGRVARTAAGLVVIHALVGRGQQLFERGAVLGEPRGAGADRERYAHAGPDRKSVV